MVYFCPHHLRHTYATKLVNAECRITSIQKLLGHTRLNSTLTYAQVYDETVAKDYYTAYAVNDCLSPVKREFSHFENSAQGLRSNASFAPLDDVQAFPVVLRRRLLLVVEQLKEPELDAESRLKLVEQLCELFKADSFVEAASGWFY